MTTPAKLVSVPRVSGGVASEVILLTRLGCDDPVCPGAWEQEATGQGEMLFLLCGLFPPGNGRGAAALPFSGSFMSFEGSLPARCFKVCVPLPRISL